MDQRTHSWIAIRAIALLEAENRERNLVKLLKPHAREASVGAWLPDVADAKRGGAGAATENHVLKMEPYNKADRDRFICEKTTLLDRIGRKRMISQFLEDDRSLSDAWWRRPFKGDVPKAGRHLPNRIMGLTTMLKDLLLTGDPAVDRLIPGHLSFVTQLPPEGRTTEEAAAMYFFMLSHFIADVSMPCHSDARKLAAYSNGLHKELEKHWSRKVGTGFEKRNLLPSNQQPLTAAQARADANRVLKQARDVDHEFGLDFRNVRVPDLQPDQDAWLEFINLCRASFALSCIIAPPGRYDYTNTRARAPFDTVLGSANAQLLRDIDRIAMFDAVFNTAIVWKHIWNKVSVE